MYKSKPNQKKSEFDEKVICIDRVCRTVKGGRRMSFRALVAIGNRKDKVGIGTGKAKEVLTAVNKAVAKAKKKMITVNSQNGTIPHEIIIDYGSSKLFMKPASSGTSLIAGGSVRTILELAGIKNILTKIIGSSSKINNAKATIIALKLLNNRSKETVVAKKDIKEE